MIISTLLAVFVTQAGPVLCPMMAKPAVKDAGMSEYAGVRYSYCCAGCREQFEKDPAAAVAAASKAGQLVGVSLFDPVSRRRIEPAKAKGGFQDFGTTRFYFENKADFDVFAKTPKTYAASPKREVLYCAVMRQPVTQYASASAYYDFDGVRYYFCCGDCDATFAKDPGGYAKGVSEKIQTPAALHPKEEAAATQAMTFACKHCGRTMKVKDKGDLDRTCNVCSCSKSKGECKPSGTP